MIGKEKQVVDQIRQCELHENLHIGYCERI